MSTTGDSDTIAQTDDTETTSTTSTNRRQPYGQGFLDTISSGWAERPETLPPQREQAGFAAARRDAVSAAFPGKRLVVPAGDAKQRSNDTDYAFRAHSAFSHLTGWASDSEPGSTLVFEPRPEGGHDVTLYFRERADRTTAEFYSDASIGEFWIGPASRTRRRRRRPRPRDRPHRHTHETSDDDVVVDEDADLTRFVSELRLVKDDYEIAQMREAVAATARGFDDIVANLPAVIEHPRGERIVEGVFHQRARSDGNTVGYDTIAASGPHACYLHWTRNDGAVIAGDLILVDAGVEADSLYTADITRTIPVSGRFTDIQRRVYETVREAADAAFAAAKPGVKFRSLHEAAMQVIATRVAEWGLLPVTAEEALDADKGGHHRRYMVHGTSHHLGIDVHDCAQARREMYYDGLLEPGMVFTIEPGLYFQIDDVTVPEEYRGIGVRIEDDILMTEDGAGEPLRRHPSHGRRGRSLGRAAERLTRVAYTSPLAFTTRPTLTGTFGMTASTHWLATASAQAVLERGGNAFDAAVAGAFVLHVVEPHLNGPGGDLVGIFATAESPQPTVLMGQGPAPAGATIEAYRAEGLDLVPGAGGLAAAVPGAVDAWLLLLRDHGTWELADVLAYAIGYARDGHALVPAAAATIARVAQLFADDWTTSGDLWMPEGAPPAPGTVVRNPAYAAVLDGLVHASCTVRDDGPVGRAARIDAARHEWKTGQVAHEAAAFLAAPHRHSDGGVHAGVITRRRLRRVRRRLRACGHA